MLLALKRFDQTAIHLRLASVPGRTSLPRVPEGAGKINATPSPPAGRAATRPVRLWAECCLEESWQHRPGLAGTGSHAQGPRGEQGPGQMQDSSCKAPDLHELAGER